MSTKTRGRGRKHELKASEPAFRDKYASKWKESAEPPSKVAAASFSGHASSSPSAGACSEEMEQKWTPEGVPKDAAKLLPFKDAQFVHSVKADAVGRKRVWKNLKQIVAAERALPNHSDAVLYSSIDAPPSFYPAKKYSDLSGLPAKYLDPQTKLRYSSADEFSQIRSLPSDIVGGLLALRKANG